MNFLLSLHYGIWLTASVLFFAIGEFLSKKFALHPHAPDIIYILIVYTLGALAWLPALMQRNQLSIIGTMWSVSSLVTTVLIGIVLFGEKISTMSIAGIVVAFIAIILLSLG